jgi:hypothetical protein
MITSKNQKPPIEKMHRSVVDFERSLDPWHEDAFPAELREAGTTGKRQEGWMALDWCGNPLGFIPDGTEYPDD